MTRSRVLLLVGALLFLGAAAFAFGPPHLTLLNTSLRLDYALRDALPALVSGAGAALAVWGAPRRVLKALAGVLCLAALAVAAGRLVYRLDAGPDALSCRELTGTTLIPWAKVSRVERGPDVVVVWGPGDTQIRVPTGSFRPEQRATLDRTIARRVSEASGGVQ